MTNNIEYEPSVNNYRRLLQTDDSCKFDLFIKLQGVKSKTNISSEEENVILIHTTLNKARIISKKINEIYQVDPTITSYTLQIPITTDISNESNSKTSYEEMTKLLIESIDNKITISSSETKTFFQVLFLLGEESNDDEIKMTSIEESLSFLFTEFHEKSIEYLSNHFHELFESFTMKYLDDGLKEEIIDKYFSNKRKTKRKETLEEDDDDDDEEESEIVNKMIESGESAKLIFHFIVGMSSEYCGEEILRFINEQVDDEMIENEISGIIFCIRRHIKKRLDELAKGQNEDKNKKKNNKKNKNKTKNIECEYSGNELSGIINFLTHQTEGGMEGEENKAFDVSGGGDKNPSCPISNLFKYDSNHINDLYYNWGNNQPTERDSWIKFDFGERKINLTSYTIRSNSGSTNDYAHPKTWTISGSDDGEHWEVINEQTNNPALNGPYKQHRFECDNKNKYYRFIQYKQSDSWDTNKNYQYAVYLSCIELFGSILSPVK